MMIVASNNITLSNVNDGSTPYVHIAYANSADGTDGFYVSGGGTNLLLNTQSFDSNWAWENIDHSFANGFLTLSGRNNGVSRMYQALADGNPNGKTFSLSFDARISADYDSQLVQVKVGPYDAPNLINITSKDSQLYKVENWQWVGQSGTLSFFVNSGKVDISNLKLEYGSVATPWCPAPSEMNPTYMGAYTDYTQEASLDPTAYQWSLIKGSDGTPGKDGLGIRSTTITYQSGASGTVQPTGTWVANPPSVADGDYLWTRIVWNYTDGTSETGYSVSKAGEKGDKGDDGPQGIPGPPGADGKTSYLHIAYANSADGKTGFTTSPDTKISYNYMGTYTDYTQAGSTDPTNYTWVPMFDSTKKRNFTSQPTTPYAVGDTWTESGATYFCTTAKDSGAFDQNDWTMQQLTIHSLAPSVTNSLYNDNLLLGTGNKLIKTGTNTVNQWYYPYLLANGYNVASLASALGTQFTISFDWSVSGSSPSGTFNAQWSDVPWDLGPTVTVSSSNTSGHISNTFSVSTDSKNVANMVGFRLDNFVGTLTVSNMKLEKGSVATPWCLSQSELTTTTRDYKGVTLNDNGLTATAGSTTVAMNSNDGFLINNASGQVFHVDTSGNLTMKGNITAGDISGVNFTGNNLTLAGDLKVSGGHIILGDTAVLDSQGLSLKGGGLSISDSQGNQTTYIKPDGTFTTNKGYFEGDITAHKLILDSSTSSINMGGGVFQVNSKGDVIANSFTATDVKITGGTYTQGDFHSPAIHAANIYSGDIYTATLHGGQIIGNEIVSSKLYSTKRESAIGTYYPISNSVYTPSFFVNDSGTISVHTTFPRSLSLATGISKPNDSNDNVGPVFKINEAFDRNTLAGSIGYGKGYDYPVPYLYGQQGGMPSYPIDSDELSIVWLNDVTKDTLLKQTYCDNYRYTQIASVSGITSDYKSKVGRIKINFGIVDSYGSYDVDDDTSAGGIHDLILVLTTGPINEGDLYHVDPQMAYFNNMNSDIKIKMVSKKVLTGATGHAYYNLYGELSTQDLGPADTYYLGVLQQGFVKSEKADSNMTWKIQIDNLDVVPDSTIDSDQSYYMPRVGGSYRELAISPNGSITTQMSRGLLTTTSAYNAEYITFSSSVAHHQPYWTTVSSDGIGFSIGDNSASQDHNGNNNGLFTRQCIYFSGDSNTNGISMDNYGNIHAQKDSRSWNVEDKNGNEVFSVPLDGSSSVNFDVPQSNHGGLQIGWVYFDSSSYNWAGTVPAIYNVDGNNVKGFAMYDQYLIAFSNGSCSILIDNAGDLYKPRENVGTNTSSGHKSA